MHLRFVSWFVLTLALAGMTRTASADPLPSTPRSRFLVLWGIGTPVWRHSVGQDLAPWQQPTLLEFVGLAYTFHRPWLEVRVVGLFGQRLDRNGNSAGLLTSINLSLPPINLGLATIVMNTPASGTNVGIAMTFSVGMPIGRSGAFVSLGGQIVTYPSLHFPVTFVLGPGVSYRFP